MPGANRSRMPPRTAYSPVSRTLEARANPLDSSHRTSASISTILPGAAENVSPAIAASGGTLCSKALTVVERMRGRSSEVRDLASRERTKNPPRRNGGIGRHPVIGLAIPRGKIQQLDIRRRKGERLAKRAGALAVARDMDKHDGAAFRRPRQRARQIGGAKGVETIGHGRQCQRAAFGKLGRDAFKINHDRVNSKAL